MRRFSAIVNSDGDLEAQSDAPYEVDSYKIWFRGFISNIFEITPYCNSGPFECNDRHYAECIAIAYQQWGLSFPDRTYGEYTVAIYDCSTRTLSLAHDRLGIMPVYFQQSSERLAFASNLALLLDGNSNQPLDEVFIGDYLCYGECYGSRTPYQKVKRLGPATSLIYQRGKATYNTASTTFNVERTHYQCTKYYEERTRELVSEGINSYSRTRGKVWCELSGGLDSSTVLSVLSTVKPKQQVGSISFRYPKSHSADESLWINAVKRQCDVPSFDLNADDVQPFSSLPAKFCAQPYHAMVNHAFYEQYGQLLSGQNVAIVLTGMGGDAVFLGDGPGPYFFADLLRSGQWRMFAKEMRRWTTRAEQQRPVLYWLDRYGITPNLRRWRRKVIQEYNPNIPWLSEKYESAALRRKTLRQSWVPYIGNVVDTWYLENILRCTNIISNWDYVSDYETEFRHPLLYLPLIRFTISIPWKVKFSPVGDRLLQRSAFADVLPRIVAERKTKSGPDQAFYNGLAHSELWQKILIDRPFLSDRGYVDADQWKRAVSLAVVGRCQSIKHFIAAATMEAWFRQFSRKKV